MKYRVSFADGKMIEGEADSWAAAQNAAYKLITQGVNVGGDAIGGGYFMCWDDSDGVEPDINRPVTTGGE